MNEEFKLRMYCLVLYNLSPIQQGIQSLHSVVRYGREHGNTDQYAQWADVDQTVIVLSGGSSKTLNDAINELQANNIICSEFVEPDLYDNVTAVCFLADERVWDKEKYYSLDMHDPYIIARQNGRMDIMNKIQEEYIKAIGGQKNFFLKNFISKYRLA